MIKANTPGYDYNAVIKGAMQEIVAPLLPYFFGFLESDLAYERFAANAIDSDDEEYHKILSRQQGSDEVCTEYYPNRTACVPSPMLWMQKRLKLLPDKRIGHAFDIGWQTKEQFKATLQHGYFRRYLSAQLYLYL